MNRVVEATQEIDNSYLPKLQSASTSTSAYSSGTIDPDDLTFKSTSSTTGVTTPMPGKIIDDFSQPQTRQKSPRSRKNDQLSRIVLDVVDIPHSDSDATPEPGSPPKANKPVPVNSNHETPMPVLEPKIDDNHDNHLAGGMEYPFIFSQTPIYSYSFSCSDSIRTTFFVVDNQTRSLMIDLEPMYVIERDINDEDYLEKIKYSTMKLSIMDEE